jgi:hypothetical protein
VTTFQEGKGSHAVLGRRRKEGQEARVGERRKKCKKKKGRKEESEAGGGWRNRKCRRRKGGRRWIGEEKCQKMEGEVDKRGRMAEEGRN